MAILRLVQITIFLAVLSASVQAEKVLMNSRKLDESPPDLDNMCGSCPCNSPCNPLASPPPPSPPPPPKHPQPSNYCPPPPSGQNPPSRPSPPYIYVNGPPGNLYPVYPYSGQSRSFSMGIIPFLISSSLWLLAL